jgi:hypothetical protein
MQPKTTSKIMNKLLVIFSIFILSLGRASAEEPKFDSTSYETFMESSVKIMEYLKENGNLGLQENTAFHMQMQALVIEIPAAALEKGGPNATRSELNKIATEMVKKYNGLTASQFLKKLSDEQKSADNVYAEKQAKSKEVINAWLNNPKLRPGPFYINKIEENYFPLSQNKKFTPPPNWPSKEFGSYMCGYPPLGVMLVTFINDRVSVSVIKMQPDGSSKQEFVLEACFKEDLSGYKFYSTGFDLIKYLSGDKERIDSIADKLKFIPTVMEWYNKSVQNNLPAFTKEIPTGSYRLLFSYNGSKDNPEFSIFKVYDSGADTKYPYSMEYIKMLDDLPSIFEAALIQARFFRAELDKQNKEKANQEKNIDNILGISSDTPSSNKTNESTQPIADNSAPTNNPTRKKDNPEASNKSTSPSIKIWKPNDKLPKDIAGQGVAGDFAFYGTTSDNNPIFVPAESASSPFARQFWLVNATEDKLPPNTVVPFDQRAIVKFSSKKPLIFVGRGILPGVYNVKGQP